MNNTNQDWKIFQGNNTTPHDHITDLPKPPSWRPFGEDSNPGENRRKKRGETFQIRPEEIEMVNAALYLRRPLLITGKPGTGKSSLAYAVARELKLGEVLYWPITTRATLKDGLYSYDAISRLQEVQQQKQQNFSELSDDEKKAQLKIIEKYITLGPLGTAFLPAARPRVLLIDEIDKSDIDLPNDLLGLFEEGSFEIPELDRIPTITKPEPKIIDDGKIEPAKDTPVKDEVINVYPKPSEEKLDNQTSKTTTPTSGFPFQVPAARTIQNSLKIARAMRPLKRKVPSTSRFILNEEATINRIIERDIWLPVTKPEPERWLNLELVVEESRSAFIWQELIDEFQQILENQGAFRRIRVWTIKSKNNNLMLIRRKKGGKLEQRQYV